MTTQTRRHPTGLRPRHSRGCPSRHGARCRCRPTWEAFVWSARDGRKVPRRSRRSRPRRRGAPTRSGAVRTRDDARADERRRCARPPTHWLARRRDGLDPHPLRRPVQAERDPRLRAGAARAASSRPRRREAARRSRRADVQALADRLLARGLDPSTIRNALMPLRAIYRRAVEDGEVAVNPTTGLELPAVRGRRDRIASPEEAAALLAALPEDDRALWATALLRRPAPRRADGARVGRRRPRRGRDPGRAGLGPEGARVRRGQVARRAAHGARSPAVLRDHLVEHISRLGSSEGLVFGRTAASPFDALGSCRRGPTRRGGARGSSRSRSTRPGTRSRR